MSKGTILYIGGFELPDRNAAAHRVLSNAKILKSLGYNVVFIDVNKESERNYETCNKKVVQRFDCWTRKYPTSKLEWLKYLVEISEIKEVASKYNNLKAIICYNYQAVALIRLKKYCNENNIKLISDCTEWYEDERFVKKIDTKLRMEYIHKKVDGIICISPYLENYYKSYVNTILIPPLVDLEEEKWKTENSDEVPTEKIQFIYAGDPGKYKDKLNYIIKALDEIKNPKYIFRIIGISTKQYLEKFPEHRGVLSNLGEQVRFLGRISHKKSIQYIKSSDFLIFIRDNSKANNAGFPTKFVESMACGIPVITTRTSNLKDYLQVEKNGFFIDNVSSLFSKVSHITREELNKMKSECKENNSFKYQNYISVFKQFTKKINL